MTNIQDFIKLPGKEVEDLLEDLIKSIAELYASDATGLDWIQK